jgi:hypothetical protein
LRIGLLQRAHAGKPLTVPDRREKRQKHKQQNQSAHTITASKIKAAMISSGARLTEDPNVEVQAPETAEEI